MTTTRRRWRGRLVHLGALLAVAYATAAVAPADAAIDDHVVLAQGQDLTSQMLSAPDSGTLLYQTGIDGGLDDCYSVPIFGGEAVRIDRPAVAAACIATISPDSRWAVFLEYRGSGEQDELFAVPLSGGPPIRLNDDLSPDGRVETGFAIAPDSSRVVYTVETGGAGDTRRDLYSVDIAGGDSVMLNAGLAPETVRTWIWITPDGAHVVFLADGLYSVPIRGGPPVRLAGGARTATAPVITTDSSTVVYEGGDVGEGYELYSVPVTGGGATRLASGVLYAGDGGSNWQVSASGEYVVYKTDGQDGRPYGDLYSVPVGGGSPTLLHEVVGADAPGEMKYEITPDGSHVVYTAGDVDPPGLELYAVPIGGGTPVILSDPADRVWDGENECPFDIAPDSSGVTYRADQAGDGEIHLYWTSLDGGVSVDHGVELGWCNLPFAADGSYFLLAGDLGPAGERGVFAVPTGGEPPRLVSRQLQPGEEIDNMVITPDGRRLLYVVEAPFWGRQIVATELKTFWCNGHPADLVGTAGSDVIHGTDGRDVIVAFEGNDVIFGGGGRDLICAGSGADMVYGGRGADRIFGQGGRDTLYGEGGRDMLIGGGRRDLLYGGSGPDTLNGEGGDDLLIGGGGDDLLKGGEGADVLRGKIGDDDLRGGPDQDECDGGPDVDTARSCEQRSGIP